jgi:hypothetical protein
MDEFVRALFNIHISRLSGENLRLLLDIVKYASNPTSPGMLRSTLKFAVLTISP